MPHFNREALEAELPKRGIAYVWMKELGGRRKKIRSDSPNIALRNDSFRNYADYMMTDEFAQGIDRLLEIAESREDGVHVRRAIVFPMPPHADQRLPHRAWPYGVAHRR